MTDNRERVKRVPLGERNLLTVSGLKDKDEFVYRWVNDLEDKPMHCKAAGWEFVDKNGKVVGDGEMNNMTAMGSGLSKGVGNGVTAYLMKTPRKQWLEDRYNRVDKPTNELEEGILGQAHEQGRYGSVSVNRGNRK